MGYKHLQQLIRWIKCRHVWQTWRMDDAMNPIGSGVGIKVYEPLGCNREKVKICSKCGEVRTFGKKITILW